MRYGKRDWINYERGIEKEWLMTNGRSAFAGETITGAHSRKYHGLLIACLTSPEERYMILNKLEEQIICKGMSYPLATTKYQQDIVKGYENQQSFSYDGLPHYRYVINGLVIEKEIVLEYGKNTVVVAYTIQGNGNDTVMEVTPFLSCRNPGECSEPINLEFKGSIKRDSNIVPKIGRAHV